MKVVINNCYGGYGLSNECKLALGGRMGKDVFDRDQVYLDEEPARNDPRLITLMEEKGSEWCSGDYAKLKIVEIPDDVEQEIAEYDGNEWVEEVHRTWS